MGTLDVGTVQREESCRNKEDGRRRRANHRLDMLLGCHAKSPFRCFLKLDQDRQSAQHAESQLAVSLVSSQPELALDARVTGRENVSKANPHIQTTISCLGHRHNAVYPAML